MALETYKMTGRILSKSNESFVIEVTDQSTFLKYSRKVDRDYLMSIGVSSEVSNAMKMMEAALNQESPDGISLVAGFAIRTGHVGQTDGEEGKSAEQDCANDQDLIRSPEREDDDLIIMLLYQTEFVEQTFRYS
eukprot:82599_1